MLCRNMRGFFRHRSLSRLMAAALSSYLLYLLLFFNNKLIVTNFIIFISLHRKGGLILNIESFAGTVPSPMLATYSGSKAFLATFTTALAEEVKSSNILVQYVNTYFVASGSRKIESYSITGFPRFRGSPKFENLRL